MASSAARHFHCTKRFEKAVRKAKHPGIDKQCETVKKALASNPTHGVTHDRFHKVRKMRVLVPGLGFGKSGGYRAIYRAIRDEDDDSTWFVVMLDLYFKGDDDDLADERYETITAEAEGVLADTLSVVWTTLPDPRIT